MGSVWRAEHIELGTPAAVKLIDESFAQSPEALTRFRREAQAAASLRSANVVQILDYGVDGETPFIAMEVLEGESLADRIERQGRLAPAECATILGQVSKALSRAHELGIVHRDLKPDNIFLVRDGDDEIAKVLDFGIAKRTGALQTSSDMATRTGSLMGTPYYMSPEQASGRRQVDRQTDIWAFAIIAYECIAGRRPFDDTNLGGLLLSICTEQPAPASQFAVVPPGFDVWFARCTAKDPSGRYTTIREAANELCAALGALTPNRTARHSHADGVPNGSGRISAVTGPWGSSRSGSVATPGALIITNQGPAVGPVAVASSSNRSTTRALMFGGAIGALGLGSVVVALVMRMTSQVTPTVAADVTSAALQSPTNPPASALAVPATEPPASSAPPVATVEPQVASLPVAGGATKVSTATRVGSGATRQTTRRVGAPAADTPSATAQQRPQDRLERDLGF